MSWYHYPPKSSSQQSLFWERKHQLGVSRMGICVQRYIKYLKCHSFSRNFLERKAKKIDVGAHKKGKWMLENKERAEKQLLTVNSVNPSCLSALKLYSMASIFFQITPSIHNSHWEKPKIFHSEWILSFKTFHSEWIDSYFIPPAASRPSPYPEPRTAPLPLE